MKKQRRTKKVLATALTVGMLMGAMSTPVEAASAGWKKDTTGWWYQNSNGSYPKNKWEKINGTWYHFDNRGYMKANQWVQDKDGTWYYVSSSGAMMANQWLQGKSGEWYYLGANGAMKTNSWLEHKGDWYYFGADGVMKTNTIIKDKSGISYYMDSQGVMVKNEWVQDSSGKKYYMGNDGAMIIDENGRTVLADVTFKVDDSWTMVIASGEGIIYVDYDMNNEIGNNFFAVVQEVEKEMEDDVLKYVRDSILREY